VVEISFVGDRIVHAENRGLGCGSFPRGNQMARVIQGNDIVM
jgi:hypothetical protein